MSDPVATSYDQVPYDSLPRYTTHPDCLATLARLHGMMPAPVDGCRVLELGCSSGGNLLPMAEALPGSQLVGIDLSGRQIDTGRRVAAALGLDNLRLEQRGILDLDASFGRFDYVIAHGVYSWVPEAVRDGLMRVCRANLAPQGVAYVSYNTYPGWYLRAPVRDLLTFHVEGIDDPAERVRRSREALEQLTRHPARPDSPWAQLVRDEADLLAKEGDYYLFHEHLEVHNQAFYFHQFLGHAQAHGLQFLGEAGRLTTLAQLPPEARQGLARLAANPLEQEQYLDFAIGRSFRRSLLVHDEIALRPQAGPWAVQGMLVSGAARPVEAATEAARPGEGEFVNEDGVTVGVADPAVRTALRTLHDTWPRAWTFDELVDAVTGRLTGVARDQVRAVLARSLPPLYLADFVGLHTHLPPFVLTAGGRPATTPLIRLQAQTGGKVCNRRHKLVELPGFDRAVLALLDGTNDRAALARLLAARVAAGELELLHQGQPLSDPARVRMVVAAELDEALARLAQALLLIA